MTDFTKDELREWQITHDHRSSPGIADSMTTDEVFTARVVAFALAQVEAREAAEGCADESAEILRRARARAEAAEAALEREKRARDRILDAFGSLTGETQGRIPPDLFFALADALVDRAGARLAAHKEDRGE